MNFDLFSGIAILVSRIIAPNNFFSFGVDFDDLISSFSSQDVA